MTGRRPESGRCLPYTAGKWPTQTLSQEVSKAHKHRLDQSDQPAYKHGPHVGHRSLSSLWPGLTEGRVAEW
ncbi:hypothetical protein MTBLM5_360005 [Magnetospirillum sp. LM-5]|nr:hypothetical protein MTBLM5_360005 [Magnetospirillum sp. LM-5]